MDREAKDLPSKYFTHALTHSHTYIINFSLSLLPYLLPYLLAHLCTKFLSVGCSILSILRTRASGSDNASTMGGPLG